MHTQSIVLTPLYDQCSVVSASASAAPLHIIIDIITGSSQQQPLATDIAETTKMPWQK